MSLLVVKTLRDLRSAWAQSLALIAIVAIGVAALVALGGSYRDLSSSYQRTYERLRFADVEFSLASAPQRAVKAVERRQGVAAASGRLIVDAGLALGDGERVRARLIGLPTNGRPAVNDLLLSSGRFLSRADPQAVIIESHFAKDRGIHPGDTVTPLAAGRRLPLKVVGVATSPEYLMLVPSRQDLVPTPRTFAVLFLPLAELQRLTGAEDRINNIAVRLAPDASRPATVRALQNELAPSGLESTTWRKDQPSNGALQMDVDFFGALAMLAPGVILIAAAISLYLMLGRIVRGQQPLIGLMKALGYRDRRVAGHYLTFALTVGLLGSLVGVVAGLGLARFLTRLYADEIGIPLVVTRFHPDLVLLGVGVSLGLAALAGLGPARSSSRLAPAEAMRLDPAASAMQGHVSLLERVARPPLALRLPIRNVFRARRRTLSTGIGVVFAFVLVLMTLGLLDSMNSMLRHTYRHVERWDVTATFATPIAPQTIATIRGLPGVRAVEPATMQLPATVRGDRGQEDLMLTAFVPSQRMHVLQLQRGLTAAAALAPGRIVLTRTLADRLDLNIGDPVSVTTAAGARVLRLGGTSNELVASAGYVSLAEAARLTRARAAPVNGLYLQADPGHVKAIEDALYRAGADSVQGKAAIEDAVRSLFGLYYAFIWILLAFALGMAFALLFNAMTVNVLERQRELATMRAIGARPSRITKLMLLENVLLWLVALVPGLLLGRWVATALGDAMKTDLFSFTVAVAPTSYLVTALGILATMLLAALPAVRRVNRADLAQATKVLT